MIPMTIVMRAEPGTVVTGFKKAKGDGFLSKKNLTSD
jgi:hypothetical protein